MVDGKGVADGMGVSLGVGVVVGSGVRVIKGVADGSGTEPGGGINVDVAATATVSPSSPPLQAASNTIMPNSKINNNRLFFITPQILSTDSQIDTSYSLRHNLIMKQTQRKLPVPSILPNLSRSTSRASLTFIRRCVIVLGIVSVITSSVMGQPDDPADALTADESRVVMLDGTRPTLLEFEAESGDVVTIIARTLEPDTGEREARNVVVDVLDADGHRLAYNDNHFGYDDDLLPTDAVIEKLILPQSGTYTIRVNTYGGIFPGEVEMRLLEADLFEATIKESDDVLTLTASLPTNQSYSYTFGARAGDVMQIRVRDTSGTLDPVLRLLDSDGNQIAFNDDHGTASTTLDVFDAMLSGVTVSADGRYTLIISDFLGRSGAFELVIEK